MKKWLIKIQYNQTNGFLIVALDHYGAIRPFSTNIHGLSATMKDESS
jgi:hypothetical protein